MKKIFILISLCLSLGLYGQTTHRLNNHISLSLYDLTTDTVTVNYLIWPDVNDGAVIGKAGTAFSDVFLAEGAVINWDSGDGTLTQTGNFMYFQGGNLGVGITNPSQALVVTGSIIATTSFLPDANEGADIGASGNRFNYGWITTLTANKVKVSDSLAFTECRIFEFRDTMVSVHLTDTCRFAPPRAHTH